MSTYRAWFFHLGWYLLGENLFKSTKLPSGTQCLEKGRLHILSGYSYKPSRKFVLNLLWYDLRYVGNVEILFALFMKYMAPYLLRLLYISLNSRSFYQEFFSDTIFSKWLGFAWLVLNHQNKLPKSAIFIGFMIILHWSVMYLIILICAKFAGVRFIWYECWYLTVPFLHQGKIDF